MIKKPPRKIGKIMRISSDASHEILNQNLILFRAISIITVTCPNLIKLGLHNCDFDESDTTAEEMYQEGGFR